MVKRDRLACPAVKSICKLHCNLCRLVDEIAEIVHNDDEIAWSFDDTSEPLAVRCLITTSRQTENHGPSTVLVIYLDGTMSFPGWHFVRRWYFLQSFVVRTDHIALVYVEEKD